MWFPLELPANPPDQRVKVKTGKTPGFFLSPLQQLFQGIKVGLVLVFLFLGPGDIPTFISFFTFPHLCSTFAIASSVVLQRIEMRRCPIT
jgi:hypothetical protein